MSKFTIDDLMFYFVQKISNRYNTGYDDSKLIALDLLRQNQINTTYDLTDLHIH